MTPFWCPERNCGLSQRGAAGRGRNRQTAAGKYSKLETFFMTHQCCKASGGYSHPAASALSWAQPERRAATARPARLSGSRFGQSGRRVAAAGCSLGPSQSSPGQASPADRRQRAELHISLSLSPLSLFPQVWGESTGRRRSLARSTQTTRSQTHRGRHISSLIPPPPPPRCY